MALKQFSETKDMKEKVMRDFYIFEDHQLPFLRAEMTKEIVNADMDDDV